MRFFAMNETPDGRLVVAAGFEVDEEGELHEVESLLRILANWTPSDSKTRAIIDSQVMAVQSRVASRAVTRVTPASEGGAPLSESTGEDR